MAINVPKKELPDCKVGETIEMTVTGEDGENFVLSPYEKETPAKTKPAAKGKNRRPRAVSKALRGDSGDHEYRD